MSNSGGGALTSLSTFFKPSCRVASALAAKEGSTTGPGSGEALLEGRALGMSSMIVLQVILHSAFCPFHYQAALNLPSSFWLEK
jgi:hypothetical protein